LTKNNNECKIVINIGTHNKYFDIEPIYQSKFVFLHHEYNLVNGVLEKEKSWVYLRSKHHQDNLAYICTKNKKDAKDKLWTFYQNHRGLIDNYEKCLRDVDEYSDTEEETKLLLPILDVLKEYCSYDPNHNGKLGRNGAVIFDEEKLWKIKPNKLII